VLVETLNTAKSINQLDSLNTLIVKIVARIQNPLSSQYEPAQTLHGEISHSNLSPLIGTLLSGDVSCEISHSNLSPLIGTLLTGDVSGVLVIRP